MSRLTLAWANFRLSVAVVVACVAMLLSGCETLKHAGPLHVLIPCRTATVAKPDFPADHITQAQDIWDQVKALLADRKVRKGYEAELETQVEVCK